MYAKHYKNPTMLSKVTAKNVGDVFLRHTVVIKYRCTFPVPQEAPSGTSPGSALSGPL